MFQGNWLKKYGWPLFLPLTREDSYQFTSLRLPLTNDYAEFDSQVLALAKVIIDSINEKELARISPNIMANDKGITKLEKYLQQQGFTDPNGRIAFLRNLWELRSSGSGHRKGGNYQKVARCFGIGQKELIAVFEEILNNATNFIDELEVQFL